MMTTISKFGVAAAVMAWLLGGLAFAQGTGGSAAPSAGVTVLELFTSQGCSSCPSADVLFKAYADQPGLIALSYSVDYWDYLGWKDTFANPKFTERQRMYGRTVSNGQIYTPQMVINGASHAVGSSRRDIDAAVTARRPVPAFAVDATRADGAIAVRAATAGQAGQARILLVTVRPPQTVAVKRGENSGRTLTYVNVVRDVADVGGWTGGTVVVKPPADGAGLGPGERYAVLIQAAAHGPVIGAGWVK
jgi:hypothetical protein